MQIKKMQIHGVRNLDEILIRPNKKINIFTGKNASGKTSILEAIYILARSKSFRTPRVRDVITRSKEKIIVISEITHEKYTPLNLKVEKGSGVNTLDLNGEKLKTVSELAKILPIITVTQDSQSLVTGTPKQRRHWLDWAMFHVEPSYLSQWKQYYKAVRQRNILLKKGEKKAELYRAWEGEMVKLSRNITEQRRLFVDQVSDRMNDIFAGKNTDKTGLSLEPGWPGDITFDDYLINQREADRQKGYTRSGPHHADVKFHVNDMEMKKVFSRGQIKMFINQMFMAQASVTKDKINISPILLMDDYSAELDDENSEYLLKTIKNQQFQTFITTTKQAETDAETAVFHVEQGVITEKPRN